MANQLRTPIHLLAHFVDLLVIVDKSDGKLEGDDCNGPKAQDNDSHTRDPDPVLFARSDVSPQSVRPFH